VLLAEVLSGVITGFLVGVLAGYSLRVADEPPPEQDRPPRQCPMCDGSGRISVVTVCPLCGGTGLS
jgi:hypothetical protein